MYAAGDASPLSSLKPTASSPFSPSKATTPETAAYYYMRGLAGSSTLSLDDLRTNVQKYRVMAQDHKRHGLREDDWVTPDEFQRRRAVYKQLLEDAATALKPPAHKAAAGSGVKTVVSAASTKGDLRKAEAECMKKLNQAAMAWPDAAIRSFLMGLVCMQSKDTDGKNDKMGDALKCFRDSIAVEPQVAGFHQAAGEILSQLTRPREAVVEFTMALRLAPDSKQALDRLNTALAKMTGTDITSQEYMQAKEVVKRHEGSLTSGSGSGSLYGRSTNGWLIPAKSGAGWPGVGLTAAGSSAGGLAGAAKLTLPTPPYDRLLFRQALAVPVGKNTLLVDGENLKDALEVTVLIDDRTLATAKVGKIGGDKTPLLATLTVSGYEFTPLTGDKTTKFKAPMGAHIYAANAYQEMGQAVRELKIKVKSLDADGNPKIDEKVLPGEAAAAVVGDDGVLAGFLAGKTDVTADGGGVDKFYPLKTILPLMGSRPSAGAGASGSSKPVPGKCFLVRIVLGETF